MQIIPTILEKEFWAAQNKIRHAKNISRWIQIDVIDGVFTEGKTFELELLNSNLEEVENVLWEIHLMVKEPQNWIEKCNFVNASRVIGQVEMMIDREGFITEIKNLGMEAGLAMDIDTEIGTIPEETDVVLLLSRKSGFGNYDLNETIFGKIKKLKEIREKENLKFMIGVDGGINEENIKRLVDAGVDIAYCGGAIFNGMVDDNLEKLKYASEN
jgi:ribulose-phosphate 3-epimerase